MTEPSPTASPTSSPTAPRTGGRRTGRNLLLGCLAGLLLAGVAEAGRVLVGRNTHHVLGDRVFRSAQLSPEQLRRFIAEHGIRTVVNLRGCCTPFPWYLGECRTTHEAGVAQEDVTLSSVRLPPPAELRRLIEVLDHTEYPIVLHCRRGSDRTGLASAIVLLLQTDADLASARHQCGLRFGHVALGPAGVLDEFFDLYEEWLERLGIDHQPAVFRHWAQREYCPGAGRATLELSGFPEKARVGQPLALTLRAQNRSIRTWQLRPGTYAGVHARYLVCDPQGNLVFVGRAGQFTAAVPPGGSIDLTLALPPLRTPGRYVFQADLIAEDQTAFTQLGSEPILRELVVGE